MPPVLYYSKRELEPLSAWLEVDIFLPDCAPPLGTHVQIGACRFFFPFLRCSRCWEGNVLSWDLPGSRNRATCMERLQPLANNSSNVGFLYWCVPACSPVPTTLPRAGSSPPPTKHLPGTFGAPGCLTSGRDSALPALDPWDPYIPVSTPVARPLWKTIEAPSSSPQPK